MKPLVPDQIRSRQVGFSLVEVVMSVAIVGLAVPTLLGMFSYFSSIAVESKDIADTASVSHAVSLYLEGNDTIDFATIYEWVKKARDDDSQTNAVYAYKAKDSENFYTVSDEPPPESEISLLDGRIMAVEIHAPNVSILPTSELPPAVSDYQKSYLPVRMDIHALNTATQERTKSTFLESFPSIVSR